VTDIIPIDSTVNGTAGEYKTDIVGLPVDSRGVSAVDATELDLPRHRMADS